MAVPTQDRRLARSENPHEALRLQLVSLCSSAGIDAAILASEDGLAIAHVGDATLCSELAAIAPFVAEQRSMPPQISIGTGALHVRPLHFDGQSLYLATSREGASVDRSPAEMDGFLREVSEGVTRILRAA